MMRQMIRGKHSRKMNNMRAVPEVRSDLDSFKNSSHCESFKCDGKDTARREDTGWERAPGASPAGPCPRGGGGGRTGDSLSSLEGCRGKFARGCEAKDKRSISSSKMYTKRRATIDPRPL